MMRKTILLTALCLCAAFASYGQNADGSATSDNTVKSEKNGNYYRNVYVELMGASDIAGISFDSRFTPHTPFGYRVGFSLGTGRGLLHYGVDKNHFAFGVPLEINAIFGKHASKFEIGIGTNLGVCSYRWYSATVTGDNEYTMSKSVKSYFYYRMFANIGYRLQYSNDFMLRVGVTPTFPFGGNHYQSLYPGIVPYVSVGYTF